MNTNTQITNAQRAILGAVEQLISKKGNAMISYSEIIEKSGYRRTTVINTIKVLSAFGLIKISKPNHKYSDNLPYIYEIIKK